MQPTRLLVTDAAAQPPRQATVRLIMTLGRIMNTIGIVAYILAWLIGLALTVHYVSRLRSEAPLAYARIFKDEPRIRNDWRLFVFILNGNMSDLSESLKNRTYIIRFYFSAFVVMLLLTPILLK